MGNSLPLILAPVTFPGTTSSFLENRQLLNTNIMVVKIGDVDMDTSNISPADVENLRQMLPVELEQQGKLSQLEIILEAIHYIQMLQTKLITGAKKEKC